MANGYKSKGDTLNWVNTTVAAVTSGQVVIVGNLITVASCDIAVNEAGVLFLSGEWAGLPKTTGVVYTQGEPLFWDVSASKFDSQNDAVPAAGDLINAAWATENATTTDTTCTVALCNPGTKV